jgi:hypothetical protein
LINYIDRVATPSEILSPSFIASYRPREIGTSLAAAWHHDDRIGMRKLCRDQEFGIEVPDHRMSLKGIINMAASIQVPALGKLQRRLVGRI